MTDSPASPKHIAPVPPPPDQLRGRGSMVRKINREVVMLGGWGPAILMQLAHPLVAAGVAGHSTFAARPHARLGRLHGTVRAMLALTFGTPEEASRAARGINRIHDRVHGRLPQGAGVFPAGTEYSAHDPELLRWVHATLVLCLPRAYELFVGPLTPEERDRYCAEAALVGPMLGIPDGYLPADMAGIERYVEGMVASGRIAVSPEGRELAREVLDPLYPRALWPLYWPAKLVTIGLLPPAIREMYGYPWRRTQGAALRLSGWALRRALPLLPSLIRHWPAAR